MAIVSLTELEEKPDPDVKCLDWFMCLKKCPHK